MGQNYSPFKTDGISKIVSRPFPLTKTKQTNAYSAQVSSVTLLCHCSVEREWEGEGEETVVLGEGKKWKMKESGKGRGSGVVRRGGRGGGGNRLVTV